MADDLTRTKCVELLREFGYTGPVSYPMPRLRELVRELSLDPAKPAAPVTTWFADRGSSRNVKTGWHVKKGQAVDGCLVDAAEIIATGLSEQEANDMAAELNAGGVVFIPPKSRPAKKAQAKSSSDGKYGGGKPAAKSKDPDLSKGPGATLECGHIATGSIASVGDKPICFVCKKPKAVTKEWAR